MCPEKNAWPLHFHGHNFRISAETKFFNPYRPGVFGSQNFCRAQNRWITCCSASSQVVTVHLKHASKKTVADSVFSTSKKGDREKVPISMVFGGSQSQRGRFSRLVINWKKLASSVGCDGSFCFSRRAHYENARTLFYDFNI
jgi:hypothetical protein